MRRCIPGWVASARLPVWYGGASRPGGRLGRLAGRTVEGPRRGAPPGLGTRRTQRRRLLRQRAVLLLRDGVLHEQSGERSMSADMSGIPQRDEGGKDENMTMGQEDSEARLAQSERFMNDCKDESGGAGDCGHPDRDNTVGCEVLSSAHGDARACPTHQEALGVQRVCGENNVDHEVLSSTVEYEVLSSVHGDDRACAIQQEAPGVQRVCGENTVDHEVLPPMHASSIASGEQGAGKKLLSASKK